MVPKVTFLSCVWILYMFDVLNITDTMTVRHKLFIAKWIQIIYKFILSGIWTYRFILSTTPLSISTTPTLTSMRNCPKHNSRRCTLKNRARICQLMKLCPNVLNTWVRTPPGAGMVSIGTTNGWIFEHNDAHSRWTQCVLLPATKYLVFTSLLPTDPESSWLYKCAFYTFWWRDM
jgi:hypothetical protein